MININEYLLSKSKSRLNIIHATDETIHQIVKDELDHLGHDADLNHIDVSEVTNMKDLFSCTPEADLGKEYADMNPDVSEWDVSNVYDMRNMFYRCEKFNGDISKWDVSNVTLMESMFGRCDTFNCDISKWNVSRVHNMTNMFYGCKSFNQDLSKWNVSNLKECDWIFEDCPIKHEFLPKIKIRFR